MSQEPAQKTAAGQNHESKATSGIQKISLQASKVPVRKTGMNSGISGGGYQCC